MGEKDGAEEGEVLGAREAEGLEEGETLGVAEHLGSCWAWMLMPKLLSRAAQEPPPLMERQPPVVPSQLEVENTPLFTVAVLTCSSDVVQVVEAKEMAMA